MRWMRWAGSLAVAVGVAAGLVGATPGPACACSCVPSSMRENFARADVVFAGKLVTREATADKATLMFEVSSVYKGKVAVRQEVVTHASGATCGLELTGPGPHLVFGKAGASDFEPEPAEGQYVGSLCGGSRPFDEAARVDLRPLAQATEPVPGKAGTVERGTRETEAGRVSVAAEGNGPGGGRWFAGGAAALAALVTAGLAWRRSRTRLNR
jgi:hypothetical protein